MWQAFNFRPIRWLARFILFLTGWTLLSKDQIRKMKSVKRAIYISPHSSVWDFGITSIFALAKPEAFGDIYTVVKPQPFDTWLGPYLRLAGCIPATRKEDTGDGFVEHTIKFLEPKKRFHLLIAPRGARDARAWKTGYYWIAKQMGIPIVVVGFDFEHRIPIIGNSYRIDEYADNKELEVALKLEAGMIIPLHPKQACIRIRRHRTPHVVQWYKLFTYAFMMTTFVYMWLSIYYRRQMGVCPVVRPGPL